MKKILVVALVLLAVAPALTFADLQIGALAMYKGDVSTIGTTGIGVNDFTFGADLRLNLGILQGSVAGLYYPADTVGTVPASLVALTDVGLCVDILFVRIGAGVGPNFSIPLEDVGPGDAFPLGVNLKLAGDVMLGNLSVGLVGYYYVASFSDFAAADFFSRAKPFVGVSVLYKLF